MLLVEFVSREGGECLTRRHPVAVCLIEIFHEIFKAEKIREILQH